MKIGPVSRSPMSRSNAGAVLGELLGTSAQTAQQRSGNVITTN